MRMTMRTMTIDLTSGALGAKTRPIQSLARVTGPSTSASHGATLT